jgi:hypothetical protein
MIGRPSRITGTPIGGYVGGIRIIPIIRVGMIFPVQLLLCSLDIGSCGGTPWMSYKVGSLSAIYCFLSQSKGWEEPAWPAGDLSLPRRHLSSSCLTFGMPTEPASLTVSWTAPSSAHRSHLVGAAG